MKLAFIPGIIATIALVLSFVSNIWCETIKFTPEVGNLPTRSFGPFYSKEIVTTQISSGGSTYLAVGQACISYAGGIDKDSKWKTTQAFAIIACIFGGVAVFWTWLAPCLYFGSSTWKCVGMTFIFCSIFQGLTLLFLQSNACKNNSSFQDSEFYPDECSWDWGTSTNISAVVLWFVAGALMLSVIPNATRPERPPPETQTVTYTQTMNPDGTTTVTETNVVKGTYIAGEGIKNEKEEQP